MNQTPHILMCPPTHFGVEYVINPWMEGNVGGADPSEAARQWDDLYRLISDRTQVALVEPAEGLPDMCFVANAGLRLDGCFVPSVFRVPQRAAEVPHFIRWFTEAGDRIKTIPEDRAFEGEGDALFHPGRALLWAGYGVRSALLSHRDLRRLFRIEVASLRLTDERFYHLDTCFCPLPDGAAMYHPAAFDDRSLKLIHRIVPEDRRIEVSEEDALGFCCNAVRIGRTLIAHHGSAELKKQLARLDFELITTPLDQFLKAGGGAKCLTLLLSQDLKAP
ncbi:MAG: arginine deiminase-related protein, partial [Phycisphaeraceae bacterium]|nr:arginine deiminase-related protein [Phycisphaeraceae bacterium]